MRGTVTLVAGLSAVVFALPAGSRAQEGEVKSEAPAQERTIPVRSFERFEFETATHKGFWAELGFLYTRTDFERSEMTDIDVDLKTYRPFARFAYGGELWEANVLVPGVSVDGTIAPDPIDPTVKQDVDAGGIGNILLGGRFIPLRTSILDAGVGANFTFPTPKDDADLGSDEVSALPFFTAAIDLAIAEARGHVGWRFFTGDNDNGSSTDQLVWGFGMFLPLFDYVDFRNEFAGAEFDEPGDPSVVNYIAGLDIRVPVGRFDLLLRPTGLAGVTRRAPDFGVGFSIAFVSPTFRPAKASSEYGDVIIE
jgi:hypothetical protein